MWLPENSRWIKKGNKTDVTINDWIQIGIYPDSEEKKDREPLYMQQHRIHSGKQTIRIELSEKPHTAGIDPNRLLMDLKPGDNVVDVSIN